MMHLMEIFDMLKLPIVCGLAWGVWSEYVPHVPLFLKVPLFVLCVYLLFLGKRTPVGSMSGAVNDQGVFSFSI